MRLVVDGGTNDDSTALTLADYATIDALIAAIPSKGWAATLLATDTGDRDASELLVRPSMAVTASKSAYIETVDEDLTDYLLPTPNEDRNIGFVKYAAGFSLGMEYFIDYTAGYVTTPYVLEQVCIELVKVKYDRSKIDLNLASEKIGQVYAYTLSDMKNSIPESLASELDYFKSRYL